MKNVAWAEWASAEDDQYDQPPSDVASDSKAQARPTLDPWGPEWQSVESRQESQWYVAWSEAHSRAYYYNIETLEQTWDMPAEGLSPKAHVGISRLSMFAPV